MGLKEELCLRKGFGNKGHEAVLSIYHTASRIRNQSEKFFRSFGLTDVQYNLLALLMEQGENGELSQVELSGMMLVNRANITMLVDRMERSGLVRRISSASDRRVKMVAATVDGKKRYMEADREYMRRINEVTAVLRHDEKEQLISLLERIRTALSVD